MTNEMLSCVLPSAIIQMDDEGLVSKLFKRLIVVAIHVSCVGMDVNKSDKD